MGRWKVVPAIIALIVGGSAFANAADIKVVGGSAVASVLFELIADFERSSGHKVRADLDGAIGAMADRVRKGEVADVVIVSESQIDALMREGKVVLGSRTDIGKVGIGLFVRKGAQKPDISSIGAFERVFARCEIDRVQRSCRRSARRALLDWFVRSPRYCCGNEIEDGCFQTAFGAF